jgi:hypothetical protein
MAVQRADPGEFEKIERGYAAELGFSPLSRGRVTPMPPPRNPEMDEFDKFLSGPGS